VTAGFTVADDPAVPTVGVIVSVGAPVTAQLSVAGWPGAILNGLALKAVIAGAGPAVTVARAVARPYALMAVSM
jgi:hypothetical protein